MAPFTIVTNDFDAPINYFFNEKTIDFYMKCFRLIITVKSEIFQLVKIWKQSKIFVKRKNEQIKTLINFGMKVRNKFHMFFKHVVEYWMNDVIENSLIELLKDLDQDSDLTKSILRHEKFINNCY